MTKLMELVKEQIRSDLRLIEQWKGSYDWADNVAKYYHKLEALVELLEIYNCGSVGGFDEGQVDHKRYTLEERAEYVLNKDSK